VASAASTPHSTAAAVSAPNGSDAAHALPLPKDLQAWLDQQERDILVRALHANHFNRTATAAQLGISLRQIRYRIARLNIQGPQDDLHADSEH
jgi:two-component system response regulator PilR (NtrC family)